MSKTRNTLRATSIKGWFEMTRETCPICSQTGGCMINANGDAVACIRIESEKPFSKNSACPSWLHWLKRNEKKKISTENIQQENSEKKLSSASLDIIYRSLLLNTELSDDHYNHLSSEDRGLSDEQIRIREYKSFPEKPWNCARLIEKSIGLKDFTGVPGFYLAKGRNGGSYWNVSGPKGILIPFRNIRNEIEGFQIRIDNPPNDIKLKKRDELLHAEVKRQPNIVQVSYEGEILMEKEFTLDENVTIYHENNIVGWVTLSKGQRYFWLSSANKPKGTISGLPAPVHVSVPSSELNDWSVGELRRAKSVWLGEGPLKQDIAIDKIVQVYDKEELSDVGTTMLGLPGVGSWRLAIPILKEMGAERVNICYDMDSVSNIYVQKHLKECIKCLRVEGFQVYLSLWDGEKDGKGIDDLLIKQKFPELRRLV